LNTLYLREVQFRTPDGGPLADEQIYAPDEINEAITAVLAEHPFSSIREISKLAQFSKSTVRRQLTQILGFTLQHLQWVLHILSECQKWTRVEMLRAPTGVPHSGSHVVA
jgi:hypothetical protein